MEAGVRVRVKIRVNFRVRVAVEVSDMVTECKPGQWIGHRDGDWG